MQLFFGYEEIANEDLCKIYNRIDQTMRTASHMLTPIDITREAEKILTPEQDLELTRKAYQKSGSSELRMRLARMLMLQEAFDEVIPLLSDDDKTGFSEQLLLSLCYMAKETPDDDKRTIEAANKALALSNDDEQRSAALANRAKAETRLGQTDNARQTLADALRLDPANKDACKRLAALHLHAGETTQLLLTAEHLFNGGVNHARLFSAKALAEAKAGDIETARETVGLNSLFFSHTLDPPTGWNSLEDFNAALADEMINHPCLRYERYGSASELTWRVEAPLRPDAPMARMLMDMIEANIRDFILEIAETDHPWARAMPEKSFLRSWCVITESKGFENWHVHQFGWLSGVYYIRVPDSISNGSEKGGCLAFGLPEDLAGDTGSAAFGETIVRPQEGLMLAFPSHTYHRTFPHGTGEKRICFAFDLRPL
jgi:tetratricopeptide (TPR) repeat protein